MNKPGAWEPAPEARDSERLTVVLGRFVVFLLVVLIGYALYVKARNFIFQPRLSIVGVIAPEEPWPADADFTIGLRVADNRWMDGAAYVVMAIDGETEIEGPVTRVPAREEADVTVTARLAPGTRVATLILYDATRDNVRLDMRHGVIFRIGVNDVRIDTIDYPAHRTVGETIPIVVHVVRSGDMAEEYLVPIAVILNEDAEELQETEGRSFRLEPLAAESSVRLDVPTTALVPGSYYIAVILTDPKTGKRVGGGIYHQALQISE
jgi:hypothetical protein